MRALGARLATATTVLLVALTGCKSAKSGCGELDLECLVDALVIEQDGQPLELEPVASTVLRAHYPAQSSATEVWAVGTEGTILQWTPASGWSSSPSGTTQTLNAVWGSAPDDVWAVGKAGTIVHWTGTAWAAAVSGVSTELRAVYGSSATNVWAVGDGGTILQWNGTAWANVASGTTNALFGVWANGSNAWAVGVVGLVLQWTGTAWTKQPTSVPSSELVTAVWGSSVSDVWIVGTHGSAAHWDGTTWTNANSPGGEWLLSAGGSGPADVWSATYASSSLLHWTGARWNQVSTDDSGLKAVWAAAPNDAWAVGYDTTHWNGYEWATVDIPVTTSLFSVFGFAPSVGPASAPTAWRTAGGPADPLTFDCPAARVPAELGFADPNGCTPSLCFSVCQPGLKCSSRAVCTKAIKDGQTSGVWRSNLGFRTEPAESSVSADLRVDVFSDPPCSPSPAAAAPNMGTRGGTGTSLPVTIKKSGPTGCTGGAGGSGGGTDGAAGDSGGAGGAAGNSCSVTLAQCCGGGASLCGVPPASCDDCPAGTRKGIICAAGSPCNTMGGITAGSRICNCN